MLNKLTINESKTKYMIVTLGNVNPSVGITISTHSIGRVKQYEYLGMIIDERLKPIFHQNAKLLALGTFASANAKDSTFALPNAKNTNMLVCLALGDAHFLRFTRRET